MGKLRARYNEKARSSSRTETQQLHPNARDGGIKALKRRYEAETTADGSDERSQHIRQVLNIPTDVRLSSTKKKRLEKFIEKQLKKESRVSLMASLSNSSIDSSLLVRSSSGIAQGSTGATEKDRVIMEFNRTKAGLTTQTDDLLVGVSSDSEPGLESVDEEPQLQPIQPVKEQPKITFGSALKKLAPKTEVIVAVQSSSEEEQSSDEEDVIEVKVEVEKPIQQVPVKPSMPAKYVLVQRKDQVQQQRLTLPILAEEHAIMELIEQNDPTIQRDVVILAGETGSGKSTQVPQFLYEAGYGSGQDDQKSGLIAVTQPRRVAAISIAQRIGVELNMPSKVSHQVRYDSAVSTQTAIKVMTDGILLKEISTDLLLLKYSCIVIDEAHERSLNTDILIGFLSRVVPLRRKMSEEGKSQKCVDGKLRKVHPLKLVIMSATLRTEDFTNNETLFRLPPPMFKVEARQYPVTIHFSRKTPEDYVQAAHDKVLSIHKNLPKGGVLVFLTGKSEILQLVKSFKEHFGIVDENDDYDTKQVKVLPLYAMQSTIEQMAVFKQVADSQRLIVVSTNVAETSLTIPGIKYVVDSGRVKERDYDTYSGVSSFKNCWTSKASADQRAGRAGRTGPGHVYRLYSSVVYEHEFDQFTKPEIQRMSIEGVVLQMKCMAIDNIQRFPFATQPDKSQLEKSEKLLIQLGALDKISGRITEHGRKMAQLPVAPRLACMVVNSRNDPYVLALAAMLTVGDPYVGTEDIQVLNKSKLHFSYGLHSDFLALVRIFVQAYQGLVFSDFCLNQKVLNEAQQLYAQLCRITESSQIDLLEPDQPKVSFIKDIIKMSFADQIAMRLEKTNPNQRLTPYKLVSDTTNEQILYLHPQSCLSHQEAPKLVVYQGLSKASQVSTEESSRKVYMVGVTAIDNL